MGVGPGVRLINVDAAKCAEQIVALHEAVASRAYRHIFAGPFPRDAALARWSRHAGPVVFAVRKREVLGFAAWEEATLEALYVLHSATGQGIGSTLLSTARPVTRLWVLEQNESGRTFYERRGWKWSGVARAASDAGGVTELLYTR
jgi:GNAT superfamily N-acetyltransferase